MDRNKIEQDAMRLVQRGKSDRALEKYVQLLRDDPRDRRIRKTVAELYTKLGRAPEAERHLEELIRQLEASGQTRMAVGVHKQLVALRPDDPVRREKLGDAFLAAAFPSDARKCFELALDMYGRNRAVEAVDVCRKLIRVAPAEFPFKVRLAELLEAANWSEQAFEEWVRLAGEAVRLGNAGEQARFLEFALRLRPDTVAVLLQAAEARLELKQPETALELLKRAAALGGAGRGAHATALLARAFEESGEKDRARPLWLEAAAAFAKIGNAERRADALRRALACGADDPAIRKELGDADRLAAQARLRLHTQAWAEPRDDEVLRVVVRASVLAQYGFQDRAIASLRDSASAVRGALATRVALGELMATAGQTEAAVTELSRVQPPDVEAADQLQLRLRLLSGRDITVMAGDAQLPDQGEPTEEELIDDDLLDDDLLDDDLLDDEPMDDELIDDEFVDDPPTEPPTRAGAGLDDLDDSLIDDDDGDDDAFDFGLSSDPPAEPVADIDAQIALYRQRLADDPGDTEALLKLGELLAAGATAAPASEVVAAPTPTPEPVSLYNTASEPDFGDVFGGEGTFAEIVPGSPGSPPSGSASEAGSGPLEDTPAQRRARALFLSGDRAGLMAVDSGGDLGIEVLLAQARQANGDVRGALSGLRDACDDAAANDPGRAEALVLLTGLALQAGRTRAARRHFDDLQEIEHAHWAREVAALADALAASSG